MKKVLEKFWNMTKQQNVMEFVIRHGTFPILLLDFTKFVTFFADLRKLALV